MKIQLLSALLFVAQMFVAQDEKRTEAIEMHPIEYAQLKQEGRLLVHYEYRVGTTNKQFFKPNTKINAITATPCDQVPYSGVPLTFSSQDDANAVVSIPFNFCFYGVNYTSCVVSTNGNIQFSTNSTAFSSTGFPSATVNMIAPFWSDCYITSGASVKVDMYSTRMVITWDSVGYYNSHNDKTNSFQCILTDGTDAILPAGKNVGFFYKKMQWTTGDASNGISGFPNPTVTPHIPATIGINQGNGIDYTLIGKFDAPGNAYDGPSGNNDGVSWLNGKRFYFNACTPVGSNAEPVSSDIGYCDTIKVCGNDSLIFSSKFLGPEVAQTINVSVNAPTLSGALTYSVAQGNGMSDLNVMINGASAANGYHFVTVTATDNGIPPQSTSYNMVINVDHTSVNSSSVSIAVNPMSGICPGQTFTATANFSGPAPDSFNWNNGSASAVTTYTLMSSSDSLTFLTINTSGCNKTIMSHVHVNPVPTAAIIGNTTFCGPQGSTTVLTASNTANYLAQGPYSFTWTGSGFAGSVVTQTIDATQGNYSVTVINNYNCSSSTAANVVMNIQPQFTISPTYTLTSIGGVVNFDVSLESSSPASCGLGTTNCIVSNTFQVGVGTTTTAAAVTTPYDGLWESAIHQYLVNASELTAAGVQPGKLSSLAFNIISINGGTTTYENFNIKLKCTSDTVLANATMDQTSLIEVFPATTVSVTTGWNTYDFPQPYLWDGTSNILVSVCFFNPNWGGSNVVEYTNVGYNSCRHADQDGTSICGNLAGEAISQNRPNIRFGNCSAIADPNDYTYTWMPTTGLSDPSIKNPVLTVNGTQVYTVTVTHTNTPGCSGIVTTTVDVPTGISTLSVLESSVFVYPNPNNGKFEISLSGYEISNEKLSLQISNTLGQIVYTSMITNSKTNLNLDGFTNGVYVITITNDRKEKVVKKIIIQH
ncbi:MAG: hypothetical protein K0S53_3166 [Bacteroidetes bacterium]|jgi:hypothetical protein|nr:hypothetical protein [Bacteroidota bacterium]MDF2451945.1 hypothetical protein [Bacteroidota bacterium]